MAFSAPDLTTQLDAVNYQSELDQNFTKIDTALSELEVEVPNSQIASGSGNANWTSFALGETGIVGTESFSLSFGTDHETLTISHPTTSPEKSGVVINGLLHETDVVVTKDLTTLLSSDGTFRIIIGAKSLGAPKVEIKVIQSDQTDDLDQVDLVLFDFDLTRTSGVYTITNLRRQANILLSQSAFSELQTFSIHLYFQHFSTGRSGNIVVSPIDCEVLYGYLAPDEMPDQGTDPTLRVQLEIDSGTETLNPLSEAFILSGDNPLSSDRAEGFSDPFQMRAGEVIHFNVLERDYGAGVNDVSGVLVVRRVFREILR